ncbi:MAG: transglutaminase family protein [Clostridiales Family XIII bacterium]|jgi:transglutaminase-like putative cysteine protease|nr:transglutaminase family protein [Clostridiales Family XIII bacterium]
MNWYTFHYDVFLDFDAPVSEHQFLLRCLPKTCGRQRVVRAELSLRPTVGYETLTDGFGNLVQTGAIPFGHTSFHYTSEGEVFISPKNASREALNPVFAYPSEMTQPCAAFEALLKDIPGGGEAGGAVGASDAPGGGASVLETALAISRRVKRALAYEPGITDLSTTAADALAAGVGVCQDFTHVFLALCRMRGIPARYCNGLMVGEGVSHAWAEVYDKGVWIGVDPTHDCEINETYLLFSVGRDYTDCSIERGVFFGGGGQNQKVAAKLAEVRAADMQQ